MTILVCGSLAFDTIMVFPDQFKKLILPDQIHILNVSFMVPDMRREYGGTAGNIAYNLKAIGGGQTYAQLSGKALTEPKNVALAGQVDAMFKGTMLRGSLLNAYAFWKMGQIAAIAAVAAFIGAAVLLLLAGLGFWHLRRTDPSVEVLPRLGARTPAPVEP